LTTADPLQIAESFRRFGVSETTKNLLAIKVSVTPNITHDSVQEHLTKVIQGTPLTFGDDTFKGITDVAKVRKAYKFGAGAETPKGKPAAKEVNGIREGEENIDERKEVEVAIIGMMALRGAT
jgi:EKC/KEOPS complex subunit CGI121/TPRKB